MQKYIAIFVFLLSFGVTHANSEVHITTDGKASVSGVKIMQLAGSTFFTRLYWGNAYVRMLVKTNTKTKFLRGTGEATTISEIKVGDSLEMTGELESGTDTLVLVANTIKNSSVQKQQSVFTGKVVSVDLSSGSFILNTTKTGVVTVVTNSSTSFVKGNRTLDLAHIQVGDTITKTSGDYDLNTKTLVATSVLTYVDMNMYKPQNYEGRLEEVMGVTLPTSIQVSVGGKSYVVNLSLKTSVQSKNKNSALLNRFVVGDTVRFYGTLREIDEPVIDADILRNLSL
jgi:hypothetical protein